MKTRSILFSRSLIFFLLMIQSHVNFAQCTASNLSQNNGTHVSGHTQCGQVFTATCSGDITSITVVYNALPDGAGDRVLYIHDGGTPGYQIIHAQTIPLSSIVVGPNVFELTTPVAINSGEVKSFAITQSAANASSASGIAYNDGGNYWGGGVWFSTGSILDNFDLTFEVQIGDACISSSVAPDITNLQAITSSCSVEGATAPTATTNCGASVIGVADIAFPITTQGTTTINWTFDDGFGNTATQTQQVIIVDDEAPVPDAAGLSDVLAECELTELEAPTATDNCGQSIVGITTTTFPITTFGTVQVLWTFTDAHGNMSTQAQNVSVTDNTAPEPNGPLLNVNSCSDVMITAPTATDNCSGIIVGTTTTPMPITDPGTTDVTWTYTDASGNMSSQTMQVAIASIDTGITQDVEDLIADQEGAQYQWLDCDNKLTPIDGATEQTYEPQVNFGNFAVQITLNGCTETSDCFLFLTENVVELNRAPRKLVKVVDLLGREMTITPNTLLVYIYDDGSREKKVVAE